MATFQKRRKRFNKVIKALSKLYGRDYNEVAKIYYKQEQSISNTKFILNLL